MDSVTLLSLFPSDWETGDPADLVALLAADYNDLSERAQKLRALAVSLVHTHERSPVLTARDAMSLLEKHHLPKRRGKWTAVALDKKKERIYVKGSRGGLRLLHVVSTKFPSLRHIDTEMELPPGSSLLMIFGGGPGVLADPETQKSYAAVKLVRPISDVVLWDDDGESATFWSIGAGAGMRGSQQLEFPDKEVLAQWQSHTKQQ